MFAEVAVPVYVNRTFTYHLPGDMLRRARVGCRVVVPFGPKFLTGFVVALHDERGGELAQSEIKDVEELVDEAPIIARDILELTRWMSEYYYAPWGECLRTALPAGAAVATEQMLTITDAGRSALAQVSAGFNWSSSKCQALELLAASGTLSSRELERLLSRPRATALIRQLERGGLVTVTEKIRESRLKPKLQNAVRLSEISDLRFEISNLSAAQQRVIDSLQSAPSEVGFSELLERARVSASVIRTLEKRGLVEVFAREVRRDPLSHVAQEQMELVTLNEDQQRALDQIVSRIDERKYSSARSGATRWRARACPTRTTCASPTSRSARSAPSTRRSRGGPSRPSSCTASRAAARPKSTSAPCARRSAAGARR